MPKRQSIKRIESTEVQGEGSYVVVRRQLVSEMRKFASGETWKQIQKMQSGELEDPALALAMAQEATERVIEWNWVDDDDNPLPLPKDDPEVFDKLTDEEFAFLSVALSASTQGAEERKNSVSDSGIGSNSG